MADRKKSQLLEDLSNKEFETSEDVEVLPTFDVMGLREDLIRGIYAYGLFFKYIRSFSSKITFTKKIFSNSKLL